MEQVKTMYKNWATIAKIDDKHFQEAISLLDLSSKIGQMMVARFPELFTDSPQPGPISLSALVRKSIENARKAGDNPRSGKEHLCAYQANPPGVPVLLFAADDSYTLKHCEGAILLPQELETIPLEFGKIYRWQGKEIVLIDYTDEEWNFVPAEVLIIDI